MIAGFGLYNRFIDIMSEIDKQLDLTERLKAILALPIRLDCKVFMCLVCMDLVPAWELRFSESESNPDELNSKLIDAGFETRMMEEDKAQKSGPGKRWMISYSGSIDNADKLDALQRHSFGEDGDRDRLVMAEYGGLYGFPRTAIEAYSKGVDGTFSKNDLPAPYQNEDYLFLAQFALSREHWQEELEVPKRWAEALARDVPDLWHDFVAESRKYKIDNGDQPVQV